MKKGDFQNRMRTSLTAPQALSPVDPIDRLYGGPPRNLRRNHLP
jgi:hypothetical protein